MTEKEFYLTVLQVADYLDISRHTVLNWEKSGKLVPTVLKPKKLFRLSDVQKWGNNKQPIISVYINETLPDVELPLILAAIALEYPNFIPIIYSETIPPEKPLTEKPAFNSMIKNLTDRTPMVVIPNEKHLKPNDLITNIFAQMHKQIKYLFPVDN